MYRKHIKLVAQGFTTIELLVVVALMLVVVGASANIFLLTSRTQKRIIANQQVQSDVRYALETMVRDIHTGSIDYSYYTDSTIPLPASILALRDPSNQLVLYRLNTTTSALEVSRGFSQTPTWHTLLSDNVQVSNLIFYVLPATNPFRPCSSEADCAAVANEMPRVTIVMTAQNNPEPGYPVSALWLQTTVLTRSYQR